ncbi:MAG: exported protein of unknown function [Nitrospira sp.]|jgi:hypothetical protein|nr:exported protein of unknown function [Nitrospira sp.]
MSVIPPYTSGQRAAIALMLIGLSLGLMLSGQARAESSAALSESSRLWSTLVSEAKALNLPTRFLERIPPHFVTFEFEDLHAFAAEYHPKDHRMVLNRSLSLNAAGRALRPLTRLTHKELDTLYHELFHAYMDFLEHGGSAAGADASLMAFAREQQHCRYQQVLITPVLQKKDQTEERFLTDTESWEALNETWAVFIGWAVWTQLELQKQGMPKGKQSDKSFISGWLSRLEKAEHNADLRGYYEPEEPSERVMARKRYLAPEFRISSQELMVLMRDVLGSSSELVRQADQVANRVSPVPATRGVCPVRTNP